MSIESFDIGDQIRLGNQVGDNADGTDRAAFTTIAGVASDPTTVTLELLKPDATTLTYAWPTQGAADGLLTREEVGRFYRDVSLDSAGLWHWTLTGTGTVGTSESGSFYVRRSTI